MYEQILDQQREEARKYEDAWVTMARHKSEVFSEFVMRDERGRRFRNGQHHNRIHLAARKYNRLIVRWAPEFGKTEQLQSLALHILGRSTDPQFRDDPPLFRGAFIGNAFSAAAKSLNTVKQYVKESEDFKRVWPTCVKATGEAEMWSREAINVVRPPSVRLKDPSLQALGAGGPILGSRLDYAICDDILTFENTRTPERRQMIYDWFKSTVLTRINEWGFVILLCNAWHPDDLTERLIREGWPVLEEPAIYEDGSPLWEAQWPAERVLAKIEELGPIEGPRKMLHKSRDEKSMRFTPEMVKVAKTRGKGMNVLERVDPANGYATYTGVDLGVSQTKRRTRGRNTSLTSFFTLLVHPSGVRQVIDIESGRWDAVTIMEKAVQKHRQFQSIVIVENNAAQDLFVQLLDHFHPIPVQPYTTGSDAAHPEFGLEKIGVEMKKGMWIVPSDRIGRTQGEVYDWEQEMYDYMPHLHCGDRLRACMFAWEGARKAEQVAEYIPLHITNR